MISRVVNWTPLGPQVFPREEVRLFPPGQLCRQTYLMTCTWRPIAARDVHPLSNQRPTSSDAFRLPYRHIIGASLASDPYPTSVRKRKKAPTVRRALLTRRQG